MLKFSYKIIFYIYIKFSGDLLDRPVNQITLLTYYLNSICLDSSLKVK